MLGLLSDTFYQVELGGIPWHPLTASKSGLRRNFQILSRPLLDPARSIPFIVALPCGPLAFVQLPLCDALLLFLA